MAGPEVARRWSVRRWIVAGIVASLFAVVLLVAAPPELIAAHLRDLTPSALYVPLFWLLLGGLLRAQRLRVLLPSAPALHQLYAVTQLDKLVGAALPGGASEAVAAWFMRRLVDVPLHLGLMSLLVGRVFDLLVVVASALLVFSGGLLVRHDDSLALRGVATVLLSTIGLLGYAHVRSPGRLPAFLEGLAARLRTDSRPLVILRRTLELGSEATSALPRGRAIVGILALTIGMHAANVQAIRALLAAQGLEFGFAAGIAIFAIFVLLRMLPVQGLGGVGTTAAWWALALMTFGVAAPEAIAAGTVLFVAFYVLLAILCVTALPLFWLERHTASRP